MLIKTNLFVKFCSLDDNITSAIFSFCKIEKTLKWKSS